MKHLRTRSLALASAVGAVALSLPGAATAAPHAGSEDRAVPECTSGQLAASFHVTDHAMSHTFGTLRLTNISDAACRTGGYGGLSYVGHGDGTQVGAAADRESGTPVRTHVVRPGQAVRQAVSMASPDAYGARRCRPTQVDGFRVYAPDATASTFVAHRAVGCANPHVHLLSHQAYR